MRILLLSIFAGAVISACSSFNTASKTSDSPSKSDILAIIEVSNPSNFQRQDAPLWLNLYELGLPESLKENTYQLRADGVLLQSQPVDRDGDGRKDHLFTELSLSEGQRVRIEIFSAKDNDKLGAKKTQAEISQKTLGFWQPHEKYPNKQQYVGGEFRNVQNLTTPPEYTDHSNWIRYEGPGIESDKAAYRIYLDERNGFDIFGKRTPGPVLQDVGLDGYESYHNMQDWGMDILKVGDSLGAGGFAGWQNQKLEPLSNVDQRSTKIIENGDLYSSFELTYDNWHFDNQTLDLHAQLSMYAGSPLVENRIELEDNLDSLAIGFVAHENTQRIEGSTDIPGDAYTYLASYGAQSLSGDNLGIAIFFKKRYLQNLTQGNNSHIAVVSPGGKKFQYYFAAYWEGQHDNKIQSIEDFKKALDKQAQMLTRPLRQRIIKNALQNVKEVHLHNPLFWSEALAESELQRKTLKYHFSGWDENRQRPPKFEYDIIGLLPHAYDELAKATSNAKYCDVKYLTTASFIEHDGSIKRYNKSNFNIDSIAPGRVVLKMYQESKKDTYRKAADSLREQLHQQPKTTNGAFWHKKKYPHQLWLDGVYMGMPFLAEYTTLFENGSSLDEVIREFRITHDILRDEKTGLYHHAWDESKNQIWADKKTGLSPNFWGRGMGWMAMALVDVLDWIPEDKTTERAFMKNMIVEFAQTLKRYQDPSGVWWQIMDKPNIAGNYRESTASSMFVYFLAKASNQGVLTSENFGTDVKAFVERSYRSLVQEFIVVHTDHSVSMMNQCLVAGLGFGRDGSVDYYMDEPVVKNDPKGTGPFILAGIEVAKMQSSAR